MEDLLVCARYGEVLELKELLQCESVRFINDADASGNTPLHMACANGHLDCAVLLIHFGAEHRANNAGNYPLRTFSAFVCFFANLKIDWAVQNKHYKLVELLLNRFEDIDVLSQNEFGRGCVTEAFQPEDTELGMCVLGP